MNLNCGCDRWSRQSFDSSKNYESLSLSFTFFPSQNHRFIFPNRSIIVCLIGPSTCYFLSAICTSSSSSCARSSFGFTPPQISISTNFPMSGQNFPESERADGRIADRTAQKRSEKLTASHSPFSLSKSSFE